MLRYVVVACWQLEDLSSGGASRVVIWDPVGEEKPQSDEVVCPGDFIAQFPETSSSSGVEIGASASDMTGVVHMFALTSERRWEQICSVQFYTEEVWATACKYHTRQ